MPTELAYWALCIWPIILSSKYRCKCLLKVVIVPASIVILAASSYSDQNCTKHSKCGPTNKLYSSIFLKSIPFPNSKYAKGLLRHTVHLTCQLRRLLQLMYWAAFTTPCNSLGYWEGQLPCQAELHSDRKLSMVYQSFDHPFWLLPVPVPLQPFTRCMNHVC